MKKYLFPLVGILVVGFATLGTTSARAQTGAFDWRGFYFGGHVGYGRANGDISVRDPGLQNANPTLGGLFGGLQFGYNYVFPSRFMIGAEADISFPNAYPSDALIWRGTTSRSIFAEQLDYIATLRARFGYAFDRTLLYATGGFAASSGHFVRTDPTSGNDEVHPGTRYGWAVGGGAEFAFQKNWTARLEYLYSHFGSTDVMFMTGAQYASRFDTHMVRLGLNRRLAESGKQKAGDDDNLSESDQWEIHGQTTYIQQGYPRFRALYTGENSLPPWPQSKETFTASAFLGLRLWQGAELYYNPELLQGFGLSSTVGAAGFPNGEAQKSDFIYPHYNTSRLFLRQTFGFGGEQETIESSYGQMAGKKDISRLTIQVGKFAVHDVFDNNAYAQDSRADFFNWSLWAAGAFDYAADKVGLTYGVVADFNQKNWALRAGYFLVGDKPNSNDFDSQVFRRGGYVTELETRYSLFSQPGKLRIIGWMNEYFAGNYRDAINYSAATGIDPTTAITLLRQGQTKYGYVFNLEQAINNEIGMFARWSWNNGKTEITAFTDIDSSLSFGTSIKGNSWGRPNDKIGIGYAINGISKDHRDYLAAGGLGILIGDGQLNYRNEKILESFYAFALSKALTLTLDYQYMTNPAYNADRGPISFIAGRVHAEF
ncbi:MAG TPA: carbohydrate porin [Pseudolabrys sp.]|nr:carbohydrate porin [Pseudolabrys sp.]